MELWNETAAIIFKEALEIGVDFCAGLFFKELILTKFVARLYGQVVSYEFNRAGKLLGAHHYYVHNLL